MCKLNTMDFSQSLLVSGLGMSIVISVLLLLAIAIVIFSKIFMITGLGVQKKVASPVQSVSETKNQLDEESYAVLMSAVCEEIQQPVDKFKIVEIKEIH